MNRTWPLHFLLCPLLAVFVAGCAATDGEPTDPNSSGLGAGETDVAQEDADDDSEVCESDSESECYADDEDSECEGIECDERRCHEMCVEPVLAGVDACLDRGGSPRLCRGGARERIHTCMRACTHHGNEENEHDRPNDRDRDNRPGPDGNTNPYPDENGNEPSECEVSCYNRLEEQVEECLANGRSEDFCLHGFERRLAECVGNCENRGP